MPNNGESGAVGPSPVERTNRCPSCGKWLRAGVEPRAVGTGSYCVCSAGRARPTTWRTLRAMSNLSRVAAEMQNHPDGPFKWMPLFSLGRFGFVLVLGPRRPSHFGGDA